MFKTLELIEDNQIRFERSQATPRQYLSHFPDPPRALLTKIKRNIAIGAFVNIAEPFKTRLQIRVLSELYDKFFSQYWFDAVLVKIANPGTKTVNSHATL